MIQWAKAAAGGAMLALVTLGATVGRLTEQTQWLAAGVGAAAGALFFAWAKRREIQEDR